MKKLAERIVSNFKENKKPLIIGIILWTIVCAITLNVYSDSLGNKSIGNQTIENTIEINKDVMVYQEFDVPEDSESLALFFSTFRRSNKGHVFVKVTGLDSGIIYNESKYNVSNLQDNAFQIISLNSDITKKQDEKISIEISSDSEVGKGVAINTTSIRQLNNGVLKINDIVQEDKDLTFKFMIDSSSRTLFSNIIVISSIALVSILILTIFIINPKYEYLFLFSAFFFGMIFMFIITPNAIPDEPYHFEKTVQLSNKLMTGDYSKIDDAYFDTREIVEHTNTSAFYKRLVEEWNEPLKLTNTSTILNNWIEDLPSILCYGPQVLGVSFGKILKVNMIKTYYLGRFFNLIFYCLCVYIALKNTPYVKTLFGLIAINPIFLQQAASYSYDCFTNGLSFVLAAYLFKWILNEDKVKIKDFIICFIACFLIAPVKYVYSFFTFLFFLVPSSRFKSPKVKYASLAILCIPTLRQLLPILLPRFKYLFTHLLAVEAEEPHLSVLDGGDYYSFKYLVSHPIQSIEIVLRTIRYFLKTWVYGALGRYLSGLNIVLPLRLIRVLIIIVVASMFIKEEKTINVSNKIAIFGICGIIFLLTLSGMLIYWTTVYDTYIQGIQGRYFCPIVIFILSLFNNKKIALPKKIDKYLIYSYIIVLFEVITYVLHYTFVN